MSARQSYEKAGFRLDLDKASYKDSNRTYTIAEIELLVETEAEVADAAERILVFAREQGIEPAEGVRGKIAEFMYHEQPDHYDALVASGTYPSIMARR